MSHSQALDFSRNHLYVRAVAEYGSQPECGCCRSETRSRSKIVTCTKARARIPPDPLSRPCLVPREAPRASRDFGGGGSARGGGGLAGGGCAALFSPLPL